MKTNKSLSQMRNLKLKSSKEYQLLELKNKAQHLRFIHKQVEYKAFYIPYVQKHSCRQVKKFEKQYYANLNILLGISKKIEEIENAQDSRTNSINRASIS